MLPSSVEDKICVPSLSANFEIDLNLQESPLNAILNGFFGRAEMALDGGRMRWKIPAFSSFFNGDLLGCQESVAESRVVFPSITYSRALGIRAVLLSMMLAQLADRFLKLLALLALLSFRNTELADDRIESSPRFGLMPG